MHVLLRLWLSHCLPPRLPPTFLLYFGMWGESLETWLAFTRAMKDNILPAVAQFIKRLYCMIGIVKEKAVFH